MNKTNEKELLSEILKWERLKGIQTLRQIIPELIDTEEKRKLYEMTDGKNGIKEIQSKVTISSGKISLLWNFWYYNGLLEKEGQKFKKIISLKELGLS
ncbi:hypothetical protein CEE44_03560 [Candidatus Woesearchaeota archaeon B3_Woes]|nr:MAG: hypothetical protein CEE44_03560 [Candidatus Woesearchaeota archaeon B3_Woes]